MAKSEKQQTQPDLELDTIYCLTCDRELSSGGYECPEGIDHFFTRMLPGENRYDARERLMQELNR